MRKMFPIGLVLILALPAMAATREGVAVFTLPAGWVRVSDAAGVRFVSPDKMASFTIGTSVAYSGDVDKPFVSLYQEAKKLQQFREEARQQGGDHDASGGTWTGAVYSWADTARNSWKYTWLVMIAAGDRAVPITATFNNQAAYNALGPTVARAVNGMKLTSTEVLEKGTPALTRFAMDETVDFAEWLMQTPLTLLQKATLELEVRGYWKSKNQKEMDGIMELLAAREQLAAMKPAERDLAREAILEPAMKEWRADTTSASAQMLVGIYDSAHKPIAAGDPPLTRQAVDAFAEFLFFAAGQTAGIKDSTPAPELKAQLADDVAKNYGSLDKEQRDLIASMPMVWAAIRVAWPDMPAEEKAQAVAAWKNTPSLVQLGNVLKPAEPAVAAAPAPGGVSAGVSAGAKPSANSAQTAAEFQRDYNRRQMQMQMNQQQFQMMQNMFINQHNHNLIMSSNLGGNNSYRYRW